MATEKVQKGYQMVVVREVEQVQQQEQLEHVWQSSFTTQASMTREQVSAEVAAISLPKIISDGSCRRWYQKLFPYIGLKHILRFARNKEGSKQITKKDFDTVVYCCNYTGLLPFAKHRRLAKIAIRILSYLAQHGWMLTEQAIDALLLECEKQDLTTLNNAMLAIAYAVENGQGFASKLEGTRSALLAGVEILVQHDQLFYLPTIAIAICALARLEHQFGEKLEAYFSLVRFALHEIDADEIKHLFPEKRTDVVEYPKKNQLAFRFSEKGELRSLKRPAQSGTLLSENDLRYTTRRWTSASGRTKMTQIIKAAVFNGQFIFPDKEGLHNALMASLQDDERKQRNNILLAIGYLIKNDQLEVDHEINTCIRQALKERKLFGLRAIINFITKFGKEKLPDLAGVYPLLEKLKSDNDKDIRSTARFCLYYLNNSVDCVYELLMVKEHSIDSSAVLLRAAQQNVEISEDVHQNLGKLVASTEYPIQARINAANALSFIAQFGSTIKVEAICLIIESGLKDENSQISKASYITLAYIVRHHFSSLLSLFEQNDQVTLEMLIKVASNALLKAGLEKVASFLLVNIIEENNDESNWPLFKNIFVWASKKIVGAELDQEFQYNLMLLLGKASVQGVVFEKAVIQNLCDALRESNDESTIRNLLAIIGQSVKNTAELELDERVVLVLISLVSSEDDGVAIDAGQVLIRYIQVAHQPFSQKAIASVCKLLKNDSHLTIPSEIILEIARRGWSISTKEQNRIAACLCSEDTEVRYNAISAFEQLAGHNQLKEVLISQSKTLRYFIDPRNDYDHNYIEKVISVFANYFKNNKLNKLDKTNVRYIANLAFRVILSEYYNYTARNLAALLLTRLSEAGYCFSVSDLKKLTAILKMNYEQVEYYRCIIKSVSMQISHKQLAISIANKNPIAFELLQKLESLFDHIEDVELLQDIVRVLKNAVKYGFKLTSIERFTRVLLRHPDASLRKLIYELLSSVSVEDFSKDELLIFNQEKNGYELEEKSTRKTAVQRLIKSVCSGQVLTRSNLSRLEHFFANENPDEECLTGLMEVVHQSVCELRQALPLSLLKVLCAFVVNKKDLDTKNVALALAATVKMGESLDGTIFSVFETLVLEQRQVDQHYLEALEIGIKRKFRLHPESIERLLALYSSENFDYSVRLRFAALIKQLDHAGAEIPESIVSEVAVLPITSQGVGEHQHDFSSENNATDSDAFNEGEEKDLEALLEELATLEINTSNPLVKALMDSGALPTLFREIDHIYETQQKLASGYQQDGDEKAIKDWTASDIERWAKYISKQSNILRSVAEMIAVVMRASAIHSHKPRWSQCLALVLMLAEALREEGVLQYEIDESQLDKDQERRGRFGQYATGQGKSLVIAMLSSIKALEGENVDVVTTSAQYASVGAKHFKDFYAMLGLNVASNEDHQYTSGPKDCYKKSVNIIYGDANNFQFDYLREKFHGLRTRNKRPFGYVILDEADNLLIDEGAKIAMLADRMPGMSRLAPLFFSIWAQLQSILQQYYLFDGKNWYCKHNHMRADQHHIDSFLFNELEKAAYQLIDIKNSTHIKIPKHLMTFVKDQIPRWVRSALMAQFHYSHEANHKIGNNQFSSAVAVPIDFQNTGEIQSGMTLGDGLQQFLHIKHGLKFRPENLITNYISNMSYFQRYGNKIYGLTGTLGSCHSRDLLSDVYPLDFVHIPSFKVRKFTELPPIIVESEEDLRSSANEIACQAAKSGRVVLVMCKTIKQAKFMEERIRVVAPGRVRLYTENKDGQSHFFDEPFSKSTIIVTTNLAARAADVKLTSEAVRNGGLLQLPVFLPKNSRVEDQAFGRAARNGEPGSAQLVLQKSDVCQQLGIDEAEFDKIYSEEGIAGIRRIRDEREKDELERLRHFECQELKNKDRLFKRYLKLRKKLKGIDDAEKNDFLEILMGSVGGLVPGLEQFINLLSQNQAKYKRKEVNERWGLWLKRHDIDFYSDECLKQFDGFEKDILDDYKKNTVIKNPSYYIERGNVLLEKANSYLGKVFYKQFYKKALEDFDKAVELDPKFSYMAYYNRAHALLKISKSGSNKEKAMADLKTCCQLLKEIYLPEAYAVLRMLSVGNAIKDGPNEKKLFEQQQARVSVLTTVYESAQDKIKAIEKSKKLMDVSLEKEEGTKTYHKVHSKQYLELFGENIKHFRSLGFRNLSAYSDITTQFQSLKLFSSIKGSERINISFSADELTGDSDPKLSLRKLLPINRNKELKELEKKEAETTDAHQDEDATEKSKKAKDKDSDKLIGAREHIGYFFGKLGKFVYDVVGVAKKTVDSVKNLGEKYKAWRYDYAEAENLDVSISCGSLHPSHASEFLSQIGDNNFKVEVRVSDVDHSLASKVLASGYQASVYDTTYTCSGDLSIGVTESRVVSDMQSFSGKCELLFQNLDWKDIQGLLGLLTELSGQKTHQAAVEKGEEAPTVAEMCNVSLNFSGISQKSADTMLKTALGDVSLSFDNLGKDDARRIIFLTDTQHKNAVFTLNNISRSRADGLVKKLNEKGDLKEQGFNVTPKSAAIELANQVKSKEDLVEYREDGLVYFYDIQELDPYPWRSTLLMAGLSVMQMAGAAAIIACTAGLGTEIALCVAAEAFNDLLRLGSILYTRQFNLESYVWQKALSLSLTAISAPWSTLKTSAQTAAATSVLINEADEVGVAVASMASQGLFKKMAVAETTTQVEGQLTKVVLTKAVSEASVKQVGKKVTQSVAQHAGEKILRQGVGQGAATLVQQSLETMASHSIKALIDPIVKNAKSRMRVMFASNASWQYMLNQIFAYDSLMQSKEGKEKLFAKVQEIIIRLRSDFMNRSSLSVRVFVEFEKQFSEQLKEVFGGRPDFKNVLAKKLPGFQPSEIESICQHLEKNKTKILHGPHDVQLHSLSKNLLGEDDMVCSIDDIDMDKVDLGDFNINKAVIVQVCIEYTNAVEDEYISDIDGLSSSIGVVVAQEIYANQSRVLSTAANAVSGIISAGVSQAISGGTIESSRQEGASNFAVDGKFSSGKRVPVGRRGESAVGGGFSFGSRVPVGRRGKSAVGNPLFDNANNFYVGEKIPPRRPLGEMIDDRIGGALLGGKSDMGDHVIVGERAINRAMTQSMSADVSKSSASSAESDVQQSAHRVLANQSFLARLKRATANASLIAAQDIIYQQFEQLIQQKYDEQIMALNEVVDAHNVSQGEKIEEAKHYFRNMVSLYLALILVDQQLSNSRVEKGEQKKNYSTEQIVVGIMKKAEEIRIRFLNEPSEEERTNIIFSIIDQESSVSSLIGYQVEFHALNRLYFQFHQLNQKEELMAQQVIEVTNAFAAAVDLKGNMPGIIKAMGTIGMSDEARLLQNEKMGPGTYLIASTMRGLLQAHALGEKTKQEICRSALEAIKEMSTTNKDLMEKIVELQKSEDEYLKDVEGRMYAHIKTTDDRIQAIIAKDDAAIVQLKEKIDAEDKALEEIADSLSDRQYDIRVRRIKRFEKEIKQLEKRRLVTELKEVFAEQNTLIKSFFDIVQAKVEGFAKFSTIYMEAYKLTCDRLTALMDKVADQNNGYLEMLTKEAFSLFGKLKLAKLEGGKANRTEEGDDKSADAKRLPAPEEKKKPYSDAEASKGQGMFQHKEGNGGGASEAPKPHAPNGEVKKSKDADPSEVPEVEQGAPGGVGAPGGL